MQLHLNVLLVIAAFLMLGITGRMDYICGNGSLPILLSMNQFSCLLNPIQLQLILLNNSVICKIQAPLDWESLLAGTPFDRIWDSVALHLLTSVLSSCIFNFQHFN